VEKRTLERWQRVAADHGQRLSELVRAVVEREISRLEGERGM
jgi:hypothetical protein